MSMADDGETSSATQPQIKYQKFNVFILVVHGMAKHGKVCCIICICLLVIIVKYASSLISKKPLVVPARAPRAFFPSNSLVLDYPHGDMRQLHDLIREDELLFVMYYAPWCGKSITARSEFQKAARIMHGQVRFLSINCWLKTGDCHVSMNLIAFPQLYAYHTHLIGFRFTGVLSAEYMVRFLENIIHPLTPLHSETDLREFVTRHDTSVLGYFDFGSLPEPPGYLQYYYASMRILDYEQTQPPEFGVIVPPQLATLFDFDVTPQVVLTRSLNLTLKYPENYNFTASELVSWILKHRQQSVVKWLVPPGRKNLMLSTELTNGPALIVFIASDPLRDLQYYYQLLRLAGLEYYSCISNDSRAIPYFTLFHILRREHDAFKQTYHVCEKLRAQKDLLLYYKKCCFCVSRKQAMPPSYDAPISSKPRMSSSSCELCHHYKSSLPIVKTVCEFSNLPAFQMSQSDYMFRNSCIETVKNYNVNEYRSLCCDLSDSSSNVYFNNNINKTRTRKSTDDFIENAKQRSLRDICRKHKFFLTQGFARPHSISNDEYSKLLLKDSHLQGLACQTNNTLKFYVMDLRHERVFADRLSLKGTGPFAVIVDIQNEQQFVMNATLTKRHLGAFIVNFTSSNLTRNLRGSSLMRASNCDNVAGQVCLTELTTETFLPFVLKQNQDVIVLFTAVWCGFCSAIAHTLLQVAVYFKSASTLHFVRIDADKNDLPWQYTVSVYPTIMMFPAHRKVDSVIFPTNLPKTLPNLIKFILRHVTYDIRLETALNVCSKHCIAENLREVIHAIADLHQHQRWLRQRIIHIEGELDEAAIQKDGQYNRFKQAILQSQLSSLYVSLQRSERQLQSAAYLQSLLSQSHDTGLSRTNMQEFIKHQKLIQDKTLNR